MKNIVATATPMKNLRPLRWCLDRAYAYVVVRAIAMAVATTVYSRVLR